MYRNWQNGPESTFSVEGTFLRCESWPCAVPPNGWMRKCKVTGSTKG